MLFIKAYITTRAPDICQIYSSTQNKYRRYFSIFIGPETPIELENLFNELKKTIFQPAVLVSDNLLPKRKG